MAVLLSISADVRSTDDGAASFKGRTSHKVTALQTAIAHNYSARLLLALLAAYPEAAEDFERGNQREPPFHSALQNKASEAVLLAILRAWVGAAKFTPIADHRTTLLMALSMNAPTAVVIELIHLWPDAVAEGEAMPLRLQYQRRRRFRTADLLPTSGDLPLHVAIKQGAHLSVVQELVRLWPDAIDKIAGANGGYALHTLIDSETSPAGVDGQLGTSVQANARFNSVATSNATMAQLHREIEARIEATKHAHTKCAVVYVLVAAGAKLNDKSKQNLNGKTPWEHLSSKIKRGSLLLQFGSTPYSTHLAKSPFSAASILQRSLNATFREISLYRIDSADPRRKGRSKIQTNPP